MLVSSLHVPEGWLRVPCPTISVHSEAASRLELVRHAERVAHGHAVHTVPNRSSQSHVDIASSSPLNK